MNSNEMTPRTNCVALAEDGTYLTLERKGSFAREATEPVRGASLQGATVRTYQEWNALGLKGIKLLPVDVIRTITLKLID